MHKCYTQIHQQKRISFKHQDWLWDKLCWSPKGTTGSFERAQSSEDSKHPFNRGNKVVFNPPFGAHHGEVWERLIRIGLVKWPLWLGTTNPKPFALTEGENNNATRSLWKRQSVLKKEMETNTVSCRSLLEMLTDKRVSSTHTRKEQVGQHKKELESWWSGHYCW